MKMSINIDDSGLIKALNALADPKFMDAIAEEVRDTIINTIQSSKNVYGQAMLPYEDSYAKWKVRNGHTTNVNFTKSGSLLNNIKYKTKPTGFTIYITDRAKKPNNLKMAMFGVGGYKNWLVFTWKGIIFKTLEQTVIKEMNKIFAGV